MSSGIARRGGAGGPALSHPVVCGGDPSQCARQPSHPRRACTPPRAARAQSPRPAELPKRQLPGDPPPLGRVILPTPGPDPSGSSHPGHAGTVLSHLLRSREAGAPAARESVRVPRAPWSCRPATAAARTVRGAGGGRRGPDASCALPSRRAAPFFRVLSC